MFNLSLFCRVNAILFLLFICACAAPPSVQDKNLFWVGILRADGVLIPFAMYDNGIWSNPWPKVSEETNVKITSLSEIPKSWTGQRGNISTIWYFGGQNDNIFTIGVSKPVEYETHCEGNWGLLTNYPSKKLYKYSPYPKLGIATDTRFNIKTMIELDQNPSEINEIISFIKPTFVKLEDEEVSKLIQKEPVSTNESKEPGYRISKDKRDKVELHINGLYRNGSDIDGQYIYYFEAQKAYKNTLDRCVDQNGKFVPCGDCDDISLLAGFILRKKTGELSLLDKHFDLTDCDMVEVSTATPFGIVIIKDRNFLIIQRDYYEAERYEILEINNSGIHSAIHTDGGGC